MSRRRRILISVGVAVVILGTYVCLFGVQTEFALLWRYKSRSLPQITKTPVPLRDLSVSSISHADASFCGYEFELPWEGVDEKKSRTITDTVHIQLTVFHSGNAFWVSCLPPKDVMNGFMKSTKVDAGALEQIYGEEATRSDYSFHQAIFSVTPSELMPFMPRREAARDGTLLLLKAIIVPDVATGLFSVQAGDFRGFQFGDPDKVPPRIRDDLFADDGGIEIMFFINTKGSVPKISQPEINRVLQSLHKVSELKPASLR